MRYLFDRMKNIFKYIILEQLLTENRIQQAKDKYPCLPPKLVDYLAAGDPSGNNKYLDWMCKQIWDSEGNNKITGFNWDEEILTLFTWLEDRGDWTGNKNPTESPYCQEVLTKKFTVKKNFNDIPVVDSLEKLADAVIEEIKFFHRFVNGLPIKDINRYDYNSLKSTLATKKLQAQEKEYAKDVNKIYEDEQWLLVSPKTHQASCVYGANTKWCVTMKNDPTYYRNYTVNNEYLIFVINKAINNKWAVHTSTPFTNEPKNDTEINLPWHQEIKLHYPLDDDEPRMRFRRRLTKKDIERLYERDTTTEYYNAQDDNITYDEFIKDSKLPPKLQQLLSFLNERFKISIARKKKSDIPYEFNENPVRLKKGDKVKLLASGYGYIKGDEGYVVATSYGPGRQVSKENAGLYTVYVPNRIVQRQSLNSEYLSSLPFKKVFLRNTDKLLSKLGTGKEIEPYNRRGIPGFYVSGININGVFLKKI